MERVSNSFKEAFKSDVREIKGYVEVIYDNTDKSNISIVESPETLEYSLNMELIDDKRKDINYATLENNYTLLDGSFNLSNKNLIGDNAGYTSKYTFENSDKKIILNLSNIECSGITIYFKDNIAQNFNLIINDDLVINIENNFKSTFQYIFENILNISKFELELLEMEYSDRRIRISEIDFGLTQIYENNELVNFEIEEEMNLFVENLPINTCTVNLNNYPDELGNKFDPINPQGIVKYLTDNVIIKPYIGILTERGIEYLPMGIFYLDDWNSKENVTLNGSNILKKLKDKVIKADNNFFKTQNITTLANMIKNTTGVDTDFINYSQNWNNAFLKNPNLFDYLQHILPYILFFDNFTTPYKEYRKFYVNRHNKLVINEINKISVANISRNQLLEDVNYETLKLLGNLNIKQPSYGIYSNFRNSNVINETYTLTQTEEYVWFTSNQFINSINSFNYFVVSGNAKAELIGNTNNMVYVKFNGTVNSSINIVCNASISDVNTVDKETTIDINKDMETLTINLLDYFMVDTKILEKLYFGLDKKYRVTANTIGDPSIELGDVVSVQTKYKNDRDGYKDIIVTKLNFNYDGGLSCSMEGVGN